MYFIVLLLLLCCRNVNKLKTIMNLLTYFYLPVFFNNFFNVLLAYIDKFALKRFVPTWFP